MIVLIDTMVGLGLHVLSDHFGGIILLHSGLCAGGFEEVRQNPLFFSLKLILFVNIKY